MRLRDRARLPAADRRPHHRVRRGAPAAVRGQKAGGCEIGSQACIQQAWQSATTFTATQKHQEESMKLTLDGRKDVNERRCASCQQCRQGMPALRPCDQLAQGVGARLGTAQVLLERLSPGQTDSNGSRVRSCHTQSVGTSCSQDLHLPERSRPSVLWPRAPRMERPLPTCTSGRLPAFQPWPRRDHASWCRGGSVTRFGACPRSLVAAKMTTAPLFPIQRR